VSVYLDASVIVPLFVVDPLSESAPQHVAALNDDFALSDFTAAEFASAVARKVRERDLTAREAKVAFDAFDRWASSLTLRVEIVAADMAGCAAMIRRLDLPLRAPDALHIAVAARLNACLCTFDGQLKRCAKKFGIPVI